MDIHKATNSVVAHPKFGRIAQGSRIVYNGYFDNVYMRVVMGKSGRLITAYPITTRYKMN